MRNRIVALVTAAWVASAVPGSARAETDLEARLQTLERRLETLEQERQDLRQEVQVLRESRQKERQVLADLKKSIMAASPKSEESQARSNMLVKGYGAVTYKSREGSNSTFEASMNPIFLWRYGDKVLFEGEPELELEDGKTETNLEYAVINYLWNDYVTFRAGKFLLPLGVFNEKLHPAWINKLPTKPLPYASRALIPAEDVGFEVRGAAPIGETSAVMTYDTWVGNGPDQADSALRFNRNYGDNNENKAFGGRLAVLPVPAIELGASGMRGQWNDSGDLDDLYFSAAVLDGAWSIGSYYKLMGEWMWVQRERGSGESTVDDIGFWLQGSARLGMLDNTYLRKLELVARYGGVVSDAALSDRFQYTLGLNYYVTSTLQCKLAYDLNQGEDPSDEKDQLALQVAYGF